MYICEAADGYVRNIPFIQCAYIRETAGGYESAGGLFICYLKIPLNTALSSVCLGANLSDAA